MIIVSAARRRSGVVTPPDPDGTLPIPYAMPTARPYNVPDYAITPSPDGTGSQVHPSVIDFGEAGWRGWRYWMAITPYYASQDGVEDPCILRSHNGYDWKVPTGLVNPVYPSPPGALFNSDTELEYDPATDRLILLYREQLPDLSHQCMIAASPDGVTWPSVPQALNWTRPYGGAGQYISPGLIYRGPGDWWMFGIGRNDYHMLHYRASDPFGAWSGPHDSGAFILGRDYMPWHIDVIWDADAGVFRGILDMGPAYLGRRDGLRAGTIAADGSTMTWAGSNVMDRPMVGWETTQIYRTTMFPHEDGEHFKIWYSGEGTASWRTGYTQMPRSEWPALGETITFPTIPPDPISPKTPVAPWNPTTLQQAIVDLGAEGYWKLNETSGTIVYDYSGHERHGVITGITGVDYQMTSGGLRLLTKSGAVMLDDIEPWRPVGGMAIFAALTSSANLAAYRHLIVKRVGTEQMGEWVLDTFGASLSGGYQHPNGGGWISYATSGVGTLPIGPGYEGVWSGISMSKPPTKPPRFYINGSTPLGGGETTTGPAGATSTPIFIGSGFIGTVRHVALFMRELTDSEVGTLMTLARAEGIIA